MKKLLHSEMQGATQNMLDVLRWYLSWMSKSKRYLAIDLCGMIVVFILSENW